MIESTPSAPAVTRPKTGGVGLRPRSAVGWILLAAALFHLAHETPLAWAIAGVPWAMLPLSGAATARQAFRLGGLLGLLLVAPQLAFFWGIFGPAAVALWGVLAGWIAIFVVSLHGVRCQLGRTAALILAPILWTGCEYFRSELYYLRFSWLNAGYALAGTPGSLLPRTLGVYGIGFGLVLAASIGWFATGRARLVGPLTAILLLALTRVGMPIRPDELPTPTRTVTVAGAQVESATVTEIPAILTRLLRQRPDAQLLVLPEYTLDGEPDEPLRDWCRTHSRHLVVGGRVSLPGGRFHNTAFVIDTNGVVVFRQTKSVPIQFFTDGEPATTQALWASPWGPLGLAICYDLSYTRVIDRLVRLGAVGLIIPTMDASSWGRRQHALHARVAPIRAAEYGLPIVRIASSGISQMVDAEGRVTASAPFSEEVIFVAGTMQFAGPGSLPADRILGPACAVGTGAVLLVLLARSVPRREKVRRRPAAPAESVTP